MHFAWDIMLWWFRLHLETILAMLWWFGQPSHMVCLKRYWAFENRERWSSKGLEICLIFIYHPSMPVRHLSVQHQVKKYIYIYINMIERVCSWVQCTRAWLHVSFCREQQQITSLCHQRKEDKGGQGCIKHATHPCETQSRWLLYCW